MPKLVGDRLISTLLFDHSARTGHPRKEALVIVVLILAAVQCCQNTDVLLWQRRFWALVWHVSQRFDCFEQSGTRCRRCILIECAILTGTHSIDSLDQSVSKLVRVTKKWMSVIHSCVNRRVFFFCGQLQTMPPCKCSAKSTRKSVVRLFFSTIKGTHDRQQPPSHGHRTDPQVLLRRSPYSHSSRRWVLLICWSSPRKKKICQ
jgi:hypothetical protein